MKKHGYNILLVGDDSVNREKIKRMLTNSKNFQYTIQEANKTSDGVRLTQQDTFDCILLDYKPPETDGITYIKKLIDKLDGALPPIVMLTGQENETVAVSALKAGAKDYLNKDHLSNLRLESTILSSIKQHALEKEVEKKDQALKTLALLDGLTKLPNRAGFERALHRFNSAAKRYRRLSALLVLDIDGFKTINDTYGHDVGDLLLQEVVSRLKLQVRTSDFISRLGGDEFAIILNEIENEFNAGSVAEKVCNSLSESFNIKNQKVNISVSIGIVCCSLGEIEPDEIVKRADIAMYRAKSTEKGSYHYYKKELHNKYQYRFKLSQLLMESIRKNEITLAYQPIVDLATSNILGFEVLSRWHSNLLGEEVPPNEFIPIAESNGYIHKLGRWVTKNAFQKFLMWRKDYQFQGFLSINLSPTQLGDMRMLDQFYNFLERHNIHFSKIHFEVTENTVMNNIAKSKQIIDLMSHKGIKIDIDDFGSGYSCLNRLNDISITGLKVDKSFVQKIGTPEGDAMIKAILAMAAALKIDAMAEGIETQAQKEFLLKLGCVMGQGYYYYEPTDLDGVHALLSRNV